MLRGALTVLQARMVIWATQVVVVGAAEPTLQPQEQAAMAVFPAAGQAAAGHLSLAAHQAQAEREAVA